LSGFTLLYTYPSSCTCQSYANETMIPLCSRSRIDMSDQGQIRLLVPLLQCPPTLFNIPPPHTLYRRGLHLPALPIDYIKKIRLWVEWKSISTTLSSPLAQYYTFFI